MAPNGELLKIGKIIEFRSLNVIYSREHLNGDGRFIHFFVERFFWRLDLETIQQMVCKSQWRPMILRLKTQTLK